MSTLISPQARPEILYPDNDGQPIAENTLQFEWIVTIKEGLEAVFIDDPNVFVAGDLLWYPVEGEPTIRMAPDTMVVRGRPKGRRGSYQQWKEGGIAPQVVFEVLSSGNRYDELLRKFQFYERYGVEEYYAYDPDYNTLSGWQREGGALQVIPEMNGWVSPLLGIRFELAPETLKIYGPDGQPFATYIEMVQQRRAERQRAEREAERAEREAERLAA